MPGVASGGRLARVAGAASRRGPPSGSLDQVARAVAVAADTGAGGIRSAGGSVLYRAARAVVGSACACAVKYNRYEAVDVEPMAVGLLVGISSGINYPACAFVNRVFVALRTVVVGYVLSVRAAGHRRGSGSVAVVASSTVRSQRAAPCVARSVGVVVSRRGLSARAVAVQVCAVAVGRARRRVASVYASAIIVARECRVVIHVDAVVNMACNVPLVAEDASFSIHVVVARLAGAAGSELVDEVFRMASGL